MVETEDYIVIVPVAVALVFLYTFLDTRTLAQMLRAPAAFVDFVRPPLEAMVQTMWTMIR